MKKNIKVISLEQLLYDVYNQEQKEIEEKQEKKKNIFLITSNINKYGVF